MPSPFADDVTTIEASSPSASWRLRAAFCFICCWRDSLSAFVSATTKGRSASRKKRIMFSSSSDASWRMSTRATTSAKERSWLKYPSMSSDQRAFSDFDTLA